MANAGLLDGVRVIDMSSGIAGPVAALFLAELGADVVKVEPPDGGPERKDPGFATWNRSKRGIVLDVGTQSGLEQLETLLAASDVIIHDLLPGAASCLGLAPPELLSRHPHLVLCPVTAWPARHQLSERKGSDQVVMARLGLCDEQAATRDGPVFLRFPFASWGAAHLAAIGILARLRVRETTGRGGLAATSLAEGALSLTTLVWSRASDPASGAALAATMPKYGDAAIFECADGKWIHLSPVVPTDLDFDDRSAR